MQAIIAAILQPLVDAINNHASAIRESAGKAVTLSTESTTEQPENTDKPKRGRPAGSINKPQPEAPTHGGITIDTLKARMKPIIEAKKGAQIKAALAVHGANAISELKSEHFEAFNDALDGIEMM